jgi:hypothetical protein
MMKKLSDGAIVKGEFGLVLATILGVDVIACAIIGRLDMMSVIYMYIGLIVGLFLLILVGLCLSDMIDGLVGWLKGISIRIHDKRK